MANNVSKIVHMPDIDYIKWVNVNREKINHYMECHAIPSDWLKQGNNKKFMIRYLEEHGYQLNL